jgi:hypothetical protein
MRSRFFRLDGGRFLALDRGFGRRGGRGLDVSGSLDHRRGFRLAVRLDAWLGVSLGRGGRVFAPFHRASDMLRLGFLFVHFRDSGGRGGVAASRRGGGPGSVATVMAAKLNGRVFVDGTGVRLFFGDAKLGEEVQYLVGLHFQLPRQLINSDLSHR